MRKIILINIITFLLSYSGTLSAQVINSVVRSGDAVSQALAETGVALPPGAYAIANNPAAMAFYEKNLAIASGYGAYNPSSAGFHMLSAEALYKPLPKIAFGFDVKHLSYNAYSVTLADGRTAGSYTPSELAVTASFSYKILEGLSAGANAKLFTSSVAEGSTVTGFGLDLATMYVSGSFRAGLNVKNIGTQVMNIKVGASYSMASLLFSAAADYLSGAGVMAGTGIQYSLKDMLFIRTGYHYGGPSGIPSYVSVGIGAKVYNFCFDVAYLAGNDNISGTMLFSLGYLF